MTTHSVIFSFIDACNSKWLNLNIKVEFLNKQKNIKATKNAKSMASMNQ